MFATGTKNREQLINSYLSPFDDDLTSLYRDIISCLSEIGYSPKKEKSSISFKHDLHNKQIAKIGIKTNKKTESSLFFSLRFSACREYSQRFSDIVRSYIAKYPSRTARCTDNNGCEFCAGRPDTHVYAYEKSLHCGAYAVEIPDITASDLDEIRKLISEEHEYLMSCEVMKTNT